MPSGRVEPKTSCTWSAYAVALSPERTMRCVIRVRPFDIASNTHSNERTARSRGISMMKEVPIRTSRMCQRIGSCPGSRVVPHEPLAKGPSSWNWAGGSSQFLMSVRQFHANNGVTSASTECSSWRAMFVMTAGQTFESGYRREAGGAAYYNARHGDGRTDTRASTEDVADDDRVPDSRKSLVLHRIESAAARPCGILTLRA